VSIRRKIALGAAAIALPLTFVVLGSGVASATTLTGSVSCTLPSVKVTFVGGLHLNTGGATDTVKGKLKDCTATEAGITSLSGAITATVHGSNTGVNGLAGGSLTVNTFVITWKGKLNGVKITAGTTSTDKEHGDIGAVCAGSAVGFTLPYAGTSTVTGAFAGGPSATSSTLCSTTTEGTILTKAQTAGGFKSLKLVSGTVHIA